MNQYLKDVFSEFRMLVVDMTKRPITNEALTKAMTLNINFNAYGYTCTAQDIVRLAQSNSLDTIYETFISLQDDVKAKPMYPNFPKQVMKMDEAQYRYHQLIHYFTTYGVEELFGVEVDTGWLPKTEETEKTKSDKKLLHEKVLTLIDTKDMYTEPMRRILGKRQRMTLPECAIVKEACLAVSPAVFCQLLKESPVPFKQNLMILVNQILEAAEEKTAILLITSLCQHTGDVLKCMDYCLTRHKYHFNRAQKRTFVRVFESYSVADFKANLILSQKKGNRNILILNYLDYNTFAKSEPHKEAVAALRNGELRSWESQMKYLLTNDKDKALDFIAKRPGMMLRMVAWLTRLGYEPAKITELLCEQCSSLSIQTLTSILTTFAPKEEDTVSSTLFPVLEKRLEMLETPLKRKKVYIDEGMFDWNLSQIGQAEEGGYLRAGLALCIPELVNYMRFFVYWNDKHRVDVDLHAFAETMEGKRLHVGWYGDFNKKGICMSGDITHSNAAEYIDIDMNSKDLRYVASNIHIFAGAPAFKSIETCFVGLMGVHALDEDIKLYDPKNCFFSHNLCHSKKSNMLYGIIDVQKRRLLISMENPTQEYPTVNNPLLSDTRFSVNQYIQLLVKAQQGVLVDSKEEADIVLTMDKQENTVSLLENNYFMDM